jgi:hypothetical protein
MLFKGLLVPIRFVYEEGVLVRRISIEVEPERPRLTLFWILLQKIFWPHSVVVMKWLLSQHLASMFSEFLQQKRNYFGIASSGARC